MTHYLRVWQAVDIENVKKHLVIAGELSGDCANCRELGIKYADTKTCPNCSTEFKFIAVRSSGSSRSNVGATVRRIKGRRPDLTFIDYDDFSGVTGKQSARDFFK